MTDWKRIKPVDDSDCVMRPTAKGWETTDSLNEKTDLKKPYLINVTFTYNASYETYGTREEVENQCELLRQYLCNLIFGYPQETGRVPGNPDKPLYEGVDWRKLPLEIGSTTRMDYETFEVEEDEE
ncbi:MAG: hypothetical protein IJU03_01030 [Thermoguttaceae bacterium]|nr:hypothetical protein [Thermoguttaceae bacterium]